jgi:hypothetical protein
LEAESAGRVINLIGTKAQISQDSVNPFDVLFIENLAKFFEPRTDQLHRQADQSRAG